MPKLIQPASPTSVVLRLKLMDSTSTSGAGIVGLTSGSAGLSIHTLRLDESVPVSYLVTSAAIQDIETLGTYVAPAANSCRFKGVNATLLPGVYELQLADSRFTASGLIVSLNGATGLAQADFEIQCQNLSVALAASQPNYAPALQTTLLAGISNISGTEATIIGKVDNISATMALQSTLIAGIANISGTQVIIISKEDSISATQALQALQTTLLEGISNISATQVNQALQTTLLAGISNISATQAIIVSKEDSISATQALQALQTTLLEGISNISGTQVTIISKEDAISATQVLQALQTTLLGGISNISATQVTIISKEDAISATQALQALQTTLLEGISNISGTQATQLTNETNIYNRIGAPVSGSISQDIQNISTAVVAGVPQNFTATSGTLPTGTSITGSYIDTQLINNRYWTTAPVTPAVGGFGLNESIYFNVGSTRVSQITVAGRFQNAIGSARSVDIWAYNYVTSGYDSISNTVIRMNHSTTDQIYTYILLPQHQDTAGNCIIRFTSTSTTVGDRLNIDQILVKAVAAGATAAEIAQAVYLKMRDTVYEGGVWIDTIGGVSGTDIGVNGINTNPVNNITDAMTIADLLNVKRLYFKPDSTVMLPSRSFDYWRFIGRGIININGQSIADAVFEDCEGISGTSSGQDAVFIRCVILDLTIDASTFHDCFMRGIFTSVISGAYNMVGCVDDLPGSPNPSIVCKGYNNFGLRMWSGGVNIISATSTDTVFLDGSGRVVIDASCTGGNLTVRGFFPTPTRTGTMTVTETSRYDITQPVGMVTGNVSGSVNNVVNGVLLDASDRVILSAVQPDYAPALQSTLITDVSVITAGQSTIIGKEDAISATQALQATEANATTNKNSILSSITTISGNTNTILTSAHGAGAWDAVAVIGEVVLSASQPYYTPAKAGDKMDIVDVPNTTAVNAMADNIWKTLLQYKDTNGSLSTEEAWVMLQATFSVLKDKMTTL